MATNILNQDLNIVAHDQCDALHDVQALITSIRLQQGADVGNPTSRLCWLAEEKLEKVLAAFQPFI